MSDVLVRSADGIVYEQCAPGEEYSNQYNRIIPEQEFKELFGDSDSLVLQDAAKIDKAEAYDILMGASE